MSDVQIAGRGPRATVSIDGCQLDHLYGFTLHADAQSMPRLELDLLILEPAVGMENVRVIVGTQTRDVLIAMGWTPPEE